MVRRETSFTDTVQSVRNYVQSFEEDLVVSFVDARVPNIVENMISSNLLVENSKATYARYNRVA